MRIFAPPPGRRPDTPFDDRHRRDEPDFGRMFEMIERILHNQEKIMSALTDAQNALADLKSEVSQVLNDFTAGLNKIEALIAAQGTGGIAEADVAALAQGITEQTAALKAGAVQLETALNATPTPAP